MSGRGHRRFLSEPTYSDFNIGDIGKNGTFDDLDFDEFLPMLSPGDFKISPPGAGLGHERHMKSDTDIYGEAITGTKHSRSGDNDDEETGQPVNRLSADFGKSTRQPSAKTASTASHRRVRSMPEVDLRMFDVFVVAPDSMASTACYDAMLPALNSMTVGTSVGEGTDLSASSADWTETWGNKLLEVDKTGFLDFGVPVSPTMAYLDRHASMGTNSHLMSPQKSTHSDLISPPYLPQDVKAEESVSAREQSLGNAVSTDIVGPKSAHRKEPLPTHRRSHTTGNMMYAGDLGMDRINGMPPQMAAHFYAGGIADTEFHLPRPCRNKTDDFFDSDDRKGARGKYRCGRCGQPKVNHDCPYVADISTRSTSTQVERSPCAAHNHPFLKERTVTVRGGGRRQHEPTGDGALRPPTAATTVSSLDNHRFSDIRILHPSQLTKGSGQAAVPSTHSLNSPV